MICLFLLSSLTTEEFTYHGEEEQTRSSIVVTSLLLALLLQDFRQLLEEKLELLLKLRDFIIDWVQEGFQEFFRKLKNHFLLLSGKSTSGSQDLTLPEGIQSEKVLPGLVLMLAQLSIFIEQSAIPRITEASEHF